MKNNRFIFRNPTIYIVILLMTSCSMSQKPSNQNLEIISIKALPFLMQNNGAEFQPIQVKAKLSADSCTAVAYIDGIQPISLQFKKGDNSIEIPVNAISEEKTIDIKIESLGMPDYKAKVTIRPVKKLVCYILPHSHTDIGYTEIQTAIGWKLPNEHPNIPREPALYGM